MAAVKVQRTHAPVNTFASPSTAPNLCAARAAIFSILGKHVDQQGRRDDLPAGYSNRAEVMVTAKIDGQIFRETFSADLSVGHESQRANSSLPALPKIVGHILCKLNAATRESILAYLPALYAANDGDLPDVPAEAASVADGLLKRLRASQPVKVRGSVSVKIQESAPPLSLLMAE